MRERLIPRIHERYGRDRSALVAAFPTYRARGAIRELGKALGLPPGEIERVARGSEGWSAHAVDRDIVTALGAERLSCDGQAGRWRAPRRARRRGARPAAPPLPALRRDDRRDPPAAWTAARSSPRRWRAARSSMWDKDSCADAGFLKIDLLGLGMLSAVERCVEQIAARARRADRPLADPLRRPARSTTAIQSAETTGVFQIESRAQMPSLRAHAAGEPRRPDDPGRDRAARADPGRRGQPLHRAPPAPARRSRLRGALRAPVARAGAARHARHDHLPGPGDRGRDGVRRLLAPARPRGCAAR